MISNFDVARKGASANDHKLLGHQADPLESSDDDAIPKGLKREAMAVGGWTLSFGTLYPSAALREEVQRLKDAEGKQPSTHLTFKECGQQMSLDVCVGPLRMARLAPCVSSPKHDIDLQLDEDEMENFFAVLQSYLLLNEINIEKLPPVFLAISRKYELLPLHFAQLEMLVDCSPDSAFRLPAFLDEYDFVLQMLGDLLPRLFWAHIARRIVLEFDESLCSAESTPMLWEQYQFRREGGTQYASLWQLLLELDLVQVMFNFAVGLRSKQLAHVLNFIVTKCVDLSQDEISLLNDRYMQQLLNMDWGKLKPLMGRCVEVAKTWPEKAKGVLRQSLCKASLSDMDEICPEICFKVEFPRKQQGVKVLYRDCGPTFKGLTLALKAVVDDGKFYIEVNLWRQRDFHQSDGFVDMNKGDNVSVRIVGLECDCVCEMRRFSAEYSACRYWPIHKEHKNLWFVERRPKKRFLLMKNVENDWFQFHSTGCSLMMNVSLRWLGTNDEDESDAACQSDRYAPLANPDVDFY